MKIGQLVSITITSGPHYGKTFLVDVEEFQPYEPSNYCWSPGWNCAVSIRGTVEWFFVDEMGVVWDFSNLSEAIGICPEQEANWEERMKFDAMMAEG